MSRDSSIPAIGPDIVGKSNNAGLVSSRYIVSTSTSARAAPHLAAH